MADAEAQSRWIREVLGLEQPAPAAPDDSASAPPPKSAHPSIDPQAVWTEAKEQVDARLATLARTMREVGDERLDAIAEKGLYALTAGGQTVGLMAALRDYAAAADKGRATAALKEAVGTYRTSLAGSEIAALLDGNPFGVDVAAKQTLGNALDAIVRLLP